jgi:hypothetical protein
MHPEEVQRVADTASTLGWTQPWVERVSTTALAIVCMTRSTTLTAITLEDLAAVRADIADAAAVSPRGRGTLRGLVYSLHTVCYQLGVVQIPPSTATPGTRPWSSR